MSAIQKEKPPVRIKPIIKWTGGKYEEYEIFSKYIPSFTRYIEPFFGGGGVFFALQPSTNSVVNDRSSDLINFYACLNCPLLKVQLLEYASAWEGAGMLAKEIIAELLADFVSYIKDEVELSYIENKFSSSLSQINSDDYWPLFSNDFIIDRQAFEKKLRASLKDKFKRIKDIQTKEKKVFNEAELSNHIETGIKSGLYFFFRSLMNLHAEGKIILSKEKSVANWYFIREFCYASMFRFNSKNEFNIPYGGTAYNKKNFRLKVEKLLSSEVKDLFKKTKIFNLDFQDFLKKVQPVKGEFIFLDPPYDSEFSEYDQNVFNQSDQVRLRGSIIDLEAKWMLVIKETEFIKDLYNHTNCRIIKFDKTYTYNVRGRNNRDTKHLIILNY